jgi:hypothetical protein
VAPAIVGAGGLSRGWTGAWRCHSRPAYWGNGPASASFRLDRTLRQSSIGAMGFNRRKTEDQRRDAAEKEAASRRATDA